jgi:hypothetical protein
MEPNPSPTSIHAIITPAAAFSNPGPSGRRLSSPSWSNGVWSGAEAAGGPSSRPAFVFYRLDGAFYPLFFCYREFLIVNASASEAISSQKQMKKWCVPVLSF